MSRVRSLLVLLALSVSACGERAAERASPTPAVAVGEDVATGCRPAGVEPLFAHGRARACTFAVNRRPRRYLLYAPASARAAPPVIIALHGAGGPQATPQDTARASRLDRLADDEGALVAFADGDGTWNDSGDASGRDDDAYFAQLLDELATRWHADRRRMFVIGWSGGAYMAHRIGCRLAGRVAAVVALQGPLRGGCRPARPVGVLQIVGTEDPLIPVAGGRTPDGTRTPPVQRAMARWRRLDGCGPVRRTRTPTVRRAVASCKGGTAVALTEIVGGGHAWYGPRQPAPDDALDATREAWRFFARSP